MDRKFLFGVFGNKSKKISLDNAGVTIPKIREILRTKFEFEVTIPADIKYYNNDFEEWVDLESDSEECIQNLKVIKVNIFFKKSKVNNDVTSNKIINEMPGLPTLLCVQRQKNMSPERPFASVTPATQQDKHPHLQGHQVHHQGQQHRHQGQQHHHQDQQLLLEV